MWCSGMKPFIKRIKQKLTFKFQEKSGTGSVIEKRGLLREISNNPYLQSKVLWNDMYGSLQTKLENSYRIIFILSLVIVMAIIGFIVVAGESKVKPYVTLIHGDEILTLDQTSDRDVHALEPKLSLYFTKQFIRTARSISADSDVNAENQIAAYALTAGAATERLNTFYRNHSPDSIAEQRLNDIHITSVLRTSAHTIEVRWKTIWHDVHTGKEQMTRYYIAQLTYQFEKPSENPRILRVNPLGFYITQLSWSEDQPI